MSQSWLAKFERGECNEPGLFPMLAILRELGMNPERLTRE